MPIKKICFPIFILSLLLCLDIKAQEQIESCSAGKIAVYSNILKTGETDYPGDPNIDVTYYKLNLTVDEVSEILTGIVTVKGRSSVASLQNFYLDMEDPLSADSVKSGTSNLTFNHSLLEDKLYITLDNPVSINNSFEVKVYYLYQEK